jgi:hypothetical protein
MTTIESPQQTSKRWLLQAILFPPIVGLQLIPVATWFMLTFVTWQSDWPTWAKILCTFTLNVMLSGLWMFVWAYMLFRYLFG